jgi:hypothetical protein
VSKPASPCSKKSRGAAPGSRRSAEPGRSSPCLSAREESAGADHPLFHSLIQPECDIAQAYCGEKLQEPFIEGEINPYDISKPCTTLGEDLCVSR